MFDYSKMIKRAVEFFPRWSDIRKRYRTSNGGNLLGTVIDESIKIEEAIQEYIDYYFLETYEGHEDEVMAFSYMATIGKIDDIGRLYIKYNDKLLMVTQDARIFNEDNYNEYIYYEEGRLFIKESLYKEDIPLVVQIDDSIIEYQLTKYHVWNIFDEFATFVNTRRYENETNKQLLDRILYITRNLPNGSEKGLKDAIISELMFFDPDIKEDDIKIERATPENLRKPYEDFESLLEKLMYINRDVFKCKRWDLDFWIFDFESLSYIPHKWNEVLKVWQNGIGHGDDLEVIIADGSHKTNATITTYNKSLEAFEKYVYDKHIDYDVDFKLVKYNNMLNKSNIKYKIKASELVDITNEDISLYLYESEMVNESRNIDELYSFGRNISIIDNTIIPSLDKNWYKLQFKQRPDKDFKITKADVLYVKDEVDIVEDSKNLLSQQPGFIFNAEKELVSAINQKAIAKVEDFQQNQGFVNTPEGMSIEPGRVYGEAHFSLGNYSGMNMTIDFKCDQVDVPKTYIKSKGSYWDENNYFVIRGNYSIEDKQVIIELEANSFKFDVISERLTGQTTVTLIDNGVEYNPEPLVANTTFAIEETKTPRKIKIILHTLSHSDVVLGNFKYSNYEIQVKTKMGHITELDNNLYRLPSYANNNLIVSLGSKTGLPPVINSIRIGESVDNIVYTTGYINTRSLCYRKFDIKTTADITLLKIEPINSSVIERMALDVDSDVRSYVRKISIDNIEAFLELNKHTINSHKPDDITLTDAIVEIKNFLLERLESQVASYIDLNELLAPYNGTLFTRENTIDDITNKVIEYINKFIDEMENYPITLDYLAEPIDFSDIFGSLKVEDKNELTISDKAEWYGLAMDVAESISRIALDKCLSDLGKFDPKIIYKGNADDNEESYIRLDLSEYETIESIHCDGGTPKMISESGVLYYNISLNKNATVSTVTITGTRDKEMRVIPLLDMIQFSIPDFNITYDKILCSRLMDSVVISRTNPGGTPYNTLIKLSSEMLSGLNIVKYKLKTPEHIGCRYGNNTFGSNDNPISKQAFDYISFYPAGGIIYEAINEYNSYIEYNRNISIVNNFAPTLNMNKLLIYTIENINKADKEKYIIRFHDETTKDNDIYSLDTWCIGRHSIAIHNNIDLVNDISYSVNTYNINNKEYLKSMIDIKDTYTINNTMILDTSQFIVQPPEGLTVKYEEYNGTVEKAHLVKTEEILIDSNRFNKLVYSNIDGIFHLSRYNSNTGYEIENIKYNLLKEQGIIIWDNEIPIGTKLFIVYTIKKPIGFIIDIEDLYKAIDYDVKAYKKLESMELSNIEDGDMYKFDKTDDIDLVHIACSDPTFEGVLVNDTIMFHKYVENNTILVKSGYYYINGREYFLYSEDQNEEIVNNEYYESENINISGGEIVTYKPTNNYINNTEMRLKGSAFIYNYDCQQGISYGISNLNTLTACDSFNEWTYFAMTPKLIPGVNGLAMDFRHSMPCGYAYLDITKALIDNELNYISLIATSDLVIYLAEEAPYLDINFNRSLNMVLKEELKYEGSEQRIVTLVKKAKQKYYLVVQNSGTLDDIIITTNKYDALNGHNKNIDLLGFELLETKMQGSEYRISIDDNKDYTPYEAALMSDGYFKTTSKLDWYITQVGTFEREKDFFTCVLDNVNVSQAHISTNNIEGYILTAPIYVNDQATIKRLIFKINDIELDQLSGFNIIAYTSHTYDGSYTPIGSFKNNKGYIKGQNLMEYVKFKIEMPANKIINNIHVFAEYKSTAENALKLNIKESGYIISKVYDLQDTLNYRLSHLGIDDISNINDIEIYVRASRDIDKLEIWHEWQPVKLNNDLTLAEFLRFYDVRFMQIKILLKTRKSYIKFNHLDVEVI